MTKNNIKKKQKIIAIIGPTSSGKSDLSVNIALYIKNNKARFEINEANIISADSRQIYKGFNLSSGKITKKEMHNIKHYMLDVASPKKTYTVSQFQRDAKKVLLKLYRKDIMPILCGGTGFWIDALLYNYSIPKTKPNIIFRNRMEKETTEHLYKILKEQDIDRAKLIDRYNRVRIIRALEIIEDTGKITKLRTENFSYNILKIYIETPRNVLNKKIKIRLHKRIKDGMIKEIEKIHKNGVSYKRLEKFGLEFKWISYYLQKKITLEKMEKSLCKEIEQYAKRQITWFKNKSINNSSLEKSISIKKNKLSLKLQKDIDNFLLSND